MEQNFCRICFKFFCCFKCRMKHEKAKHNLKPLEVCDICRYGRMYFNSDIKDNSELILHISEGHPILYCHRCKIFFNHASELMKASKCGGKQEKEVAESKSVVLSGNNIKTVKSDYFKNRPSVTTSTPMNGNNIEINIEIVSPTENSSNTNQIFTNITPINNCNIPLITPLRSIMSKNKSSRDSDNKHVTFSDAVSDSSKLTNNSKGSFLVANSNEIKNKKYVRETTIATFELSPSTPNGSSAEIFYTPEGRISTWNVESDTENKCQNIEEQKPRLKGFFDNISKVFSNVIKAVFKPEETEQYYTNTSGSIKRFLSPNADHTVPKLKRLCVRGRRPINRTNYTLNQKR